MTFAVQFIPARLVFLAVCCASFEEIAMAEGISFAQDTLGAVPAGWMCGVTGSGAPKWAIELDTSGSAARHVLKQSGSGTFPWCVKRDALLENGFVEVKFKPIAGREDAAGGVVWRWKDRDNYYVARANALENNVSLYHTSNGKRVTIKYVDAPVPLGRWHLLRVDFSGDSIRVTYDGKPYIDARDDHITGAGAVGVWTKADSVTAFDEFAFGAAPTR